MTVRIGLIITGGTGPLAAASKLAWLGAKRAFTLAGGRIDENAIVFAVRTEPILRGVGTATRVALAMQSARTSAQHHASEVAHARSEGTGVSEPQSTEFRLVQERIAALSSRLDRLTQYEGS